MNCGSNWCAPSDMLQRGPMAGLSMAGSEEGIEARLYNRHLNLTVPTPVNSAKLRTLLQPLVRGGGQGD